MGAVETVSAAAVWQPFPQIETERLTLRHVQAADADALYRIFADEATMEYWSCRPYTAVDQARALVDRITFGIREGSAIHWALMPRGDDRLIGLCGYNEWRQKHRRGDISYILAPEHAGRGLASEALAAVLDYGFDRMALHSVEAGVTPGNAASTKMLERFGFRLEGHLLESYFAEDRFVDSLIYSLLARDWRARARR